MKRNISVVLISLLLCCLYAQVQKPKRLYEYKVEDPIATVVVCPGGSYSWHDKQTEGHEVAKWLQSQGFSAYVLLYRVQGWPAFAFGYRYLVRGHQYPDAQNDLRQTMLWLRQNADSLGIDAHNIAALGFSAGGHLVASAGALFETEVRPNKVIPVYPVVTLSDEKYVHKRSRRALLGEYRKRKTIWRDSLSLEKHITSQMPPTLLVNCKDDPIVHYHNSELLDSALTAEGIPHRYLQYQTGGHGFGADSLKAGKEAIQWLDALLEFLKN